MLLITDAGDELARRLKTAMEMVRAERDTARYVHRVVKTGRTRFIEVDIVAGPKFALQTVAGQDRLRESIWRALSLSIEERRVGTSSHLTI